MESSPPDRAGEIASDISIILVTAANLIFLPGSTSILRGAPAKQMEVLPEYRC
jgi:hypothetical protein